MYVFISYTVYLSPFFSPGLQRVGLQCLGALAQRLRWGRAQLQRRVELHLATVATWPRGDANHGDMYMYIMYTYSISMVMVYPW